MKSIEIARKLRRHQTDAENHLWHYLRNRRLLGFKFRRQYPIGRYVVDFACTEKAFIIELDGGQHAEQQARDRARTHFLEQQGYRVIRFWDDAVLKDTDTVLEVIRLHLQQ